MDPWIRSDQLSLDPWDVADPYRWLLGEELIVVVPGWIFIDEQPLSFGVGGKKFGAFCWTKIHGLFFLFRNLICYCNPQKVGTERTFFQWLGIVTGFVLLGGDSSEVQDQLRNVQSIYATNKAFAAILADGTVVTWGDAETSTEI